MPQRTDTFDLTRHLVAGEVRLDVLLDVVLAERLAVAHHDDGLQALAELLVVDPEDRGLGDALVP